MPKNGGGDKYPQEIIFNTPASSNTTWVSVGVEIPLLNLPGATANTARVIEILEIEYIPLVSAVSPSFAAVSSVDYGGQTVSNFPVSSVAQDIRNVSFRNCPILGAADTNIVDDLTVKDKGVLFPGPTIFVNLPSGATGNSFNIRIMYRVKNVSNIEYIGLVNQYLIGANVM